LLPFLSSPRLSRSPSSPDRTRQPAAPAETFTFSS